MAGDVPIDRPATAGGLRMMVTRPSFLSWIALSMMTVSSVASLLTAPTMAVYGLASVFLYVVPALVFLLPTALVAAELAYGWPGGVYRWASEGLSHPLGLLAVWCQFAMTIFSFPAVLGYVASTLAYNYDPSLAGNGLYTGALIVVAFWGSVLVSIRGGVSAIATLASNGLIIGTLIPGRCSCCSASPTCCRATRRPPPPTSSTCYRPERASRASCCSSTRSSATRGWR